MPWFKKLAIVAALAATLTSEASAHDYFSSYYSRGFFYPPPYWMFFPHPFQLSVPMLPQRVIIIRERDRRGPSSGEREDPATSEERDPEYDISRNFSDFTATVQPLLRPQGTTTVAQIEEKANAVAAKVSGIENKLGELEKKQVQLADELKQTLESHSKNLDSKIAEITKKLDEVGGYRQQIKDELAKSLADYAKQTDQRMTSVEAKVGSVTKKIDELGKKQDEFQEELRKSLRDYSRQN